GASQAEEGGAGWGRPSHGQAPRPVRNRGQEEAGDSRETEAENHLVRVPDHGRERTAERIAVNIRREPYRHRERRPDRGKQEEGAKAGRKESDTARRRCARVNGGDWHRPAPSHVTPANMPTRLHVT